MPSLQPSSQIRRASSRFSTRSPAASVRLRYGRNLLAATLTAALLAACSGSDQGKAGAGAPGGAMGPMPVTALAVQSQRLPAMLEAKGFAVNVLAREQEQISNRFARALSDKWAEVKRSVGHAHAARRRLAVEIRHDDDRL